MSSADYEERGGTAASRATSAIQSPVDHFHYSHSAQHASSSLDDTDSSTWSSLGGPQTASTSSTNLSPAQISSTLDSQTTIKSTQKPPNTNLDLSISEAVARNELLLRDAVFPEWKDDTAGEEDLDSPEELQKKDPLGTQIWKLYHRTKSRLPNQERMENLTWRMMAMNLRRREREQLQAAYDSFYSGSDSRMAGADSLLSSGLKAQVKNPLPASNAPSGIAQQLRKSVDSSAETEQSPLDPMNLDDLDRKSVV